MQQQVNAEFAYYAMGISCTSCKMPRMRIRLREFRNKLGLTIEEIAEKSRYSVSQLSRWETGDSNIPSKNLPALAATYSCRVSQIFAEDWETDEQPLPSEDEIAGMISMAMQELPLGVSYADYPTAVASSVREQLEQFVAAGGFRENLAEEIVPDRAAQSAPTTKRSGAGASRSR